MPLNKYRYIVVEGPIGVGKTSLARRLAEHAAAQAMLEKPQDNPFLARFYEDAARYALPTQLFFLFQRLDEVRELTQMDMFQSRTIADYLFDKDDLFARLNLSDDEYTLYQSIYRNLAPQAPAPDLVIYLQASVDTLVERVRPRPIWSSICRPRSIPWSSACAGAATVMNAPSRTSIWRIWPTATTNSFITTRLHRCWW